MATFASILCYFAIQSVIIGCHGDFVLLSRNKRQITAAGTSAANVSSIYEMDVVCNITNRFTTTMVTSKMKNWESVSREKLFPVILPKTAFISDFLMEIDGTPYKAFVMGKEEALRVYDQAKSTGRAAAHIGTSARDSNRFEVSVNVEPQSKVTFKLTYQEMLERKGGKYEAILNMHPGQVVKDIEARVYINEPTPIKFVNTPALRRGNDISASEGQLDTQKSLEDTRAVVRFKPTIEQQLQFEKDLGAKKGSGIAGQFVVQYDVKRPEGGEVVFDEENFVHFFSVEEKQTLLSHVVFVLDTSGSMDGTKIRQLKDAMAIILDQINDDSLLNVIDFASCQRVWNITDATTVKLCGANMNTVVLPHPARVTESAISGAKLLTQKLGASGGTEMFPALKIALTTIRRSKRENGEYRSMIVLLTDGQPTDDMGKQGIIDQVTALNKDLGAAIFTLAFGNDADEEFLEKLAGRNKGSFKHIYASRDARLQLNNFYKTIADLLLADIKFGYSGGVSEVTKNQYDMYFKGSEIVVAGKLGSDKSSFSPQVSYTTSRGPVSVAPQKKRSSSPLAKSWAYMTIKDKLEESKTAANKDELVRKALDMAVKYSFVTDVTSLVVVKPHGTDVVNPEEVHAVDIPEDPNRPIMPIVTPKQVSTAEKTTSSAHRIVGSYYLLIPFFYLFFKLMT